MKFADSVFDAALQAIRSDTTAIHMTSAEANSFAEATGALNLGSRAAPTISVQEAPPTNTGRQVRVVAFTDGTTDATGTATHWALVNATGSALLATGTFSNPQVVTSGNPWQLTADLPLIIRQPV